MNNTASQEQAAPAEAAVQPRFKLAPLEPTEAMKEAACEIDAYEIACDEHQRKFPLVPRMASAGDVFAVMYRAALASSPPAGEGALDLSAINELAKVYASSYASPHHITFTVEGLRSLLSHQAAPQAGHGSQVEGTALSSAAPSDGASAPELGDTVRHIPSGEEWLVAYVRDGRLAACGWPDEIVPASDCVLVSRMPLAKKLNLLRDLSRSTGHRAAYARSMLESAFLCVGPWQVARDSQAQGASTKEQA